MRRLITGWVSLAALALVACAAGRADRSGTSTPPGGAPPLFEKATTPRVTLAGTIVRVNAAKRLITVEAPDGHRVTMRVHARVTTFDALRPGDSMRATYYESVAYDVRAPGTAAPIDAPASADAGVPEASDARSVTITARITAVDAAAGTLTLQAPDADALTIRVKHPGALATVKAGDLADVTLTEAVAMAVEKTP